jgi:hypothetical protein
MAGWWAPTRWGWLIALGLATAAVAFSAGLTVNGGNLGSGKADTPCDSDGVTVLEVLSGNNVASVDVSGIASACGTGTVSVTVRNGSVQGAASATIPSGGGGPVNVDITPDVPLTQATSVFVLLQGP